MLDRIEVTDWDAHRRDPSAHHNADFRTSGGGGKPWTVQFDIDQPDLLGTALVRIIRASSNWAPNGLKILNVLIDTGESSTYSVTYQIRTTTTDASPSTIATVATSASLLAETGVLTNDVVPVNGYIYAVLPATDVNKLGLEVDFDII